MTDIPQPADVEDWDPSAAQMSSIGAQIREPEWVRAFTESGGSPEGLRDMWKTMPRDVRPSLQKVLEDATRSYINHEPIDPRLEPYVKANLGIKPEDPVDVAMKDMFTKDPTLAAQAARIKLGLDPRASATAGKPPSVTTRAQLRDAVISGKISDPNVIRAYEQGFEEEEKKKTTTTSAPRNLNTRQEQAKANIAALELQKNQIIYPKTQEGKAAWEALSEDERDTFEDYGAGGKWRINPRVIAQLNKQYQRLSQLDERTMAQEDELAEAGITRSDGSKVQVGDEDFEATYRGYLIWKAQQGGATR